MSRTKHYSYNGTDKDYTYWNFHCDKQETLGYKAFFEVLDKLEFLSALSQEKPFLKMSARNDHPTAACQLKNYLKIAEAHPELRSLAVAISEFKYFTTHVNPKESAAFKNLFKHLVSDINSNNKSNQVIIRHFTHLADQLTHPDPKIYKMSFEDIENFSKNLDKDLLGKAPLNPIIKASVYMVIGAVVGGMLGIGFGAALAAYTGGFGAIPGMLLGMSKGAALEITVSGCAGSLFGSVCAGVTGLKNNINKNNIYLDKQKGLHRNNTLMSKADAITDRLKELRKISCT